MSQPLTFRPGPPFRGRQPPHRGGRGVYYQPHMPFDPVCCASVFPGASALPEEDDFVNAIMVHHSKLTPSSDEQQAIASLVTKVTECLEAIAVYPGKFEQNHIEETKPIGSFKKGTMLAGHCVADLVVILRTLPTFEATSALGQLLKDEFLTKEPDVNGDDGPEVDVRPYGFDFSYLGATIRVAFSAHQSLLKKIDPEVHISAADQTLALAGIRHARWTEENASHPNVKALIRILKDFRRRFLGFNYLSPWHIDLLAFYAVMQNPSNQPLSLPTAFKRVIQVLSAGLFLPGSAGFIDPCEPNNRRVHSSIPLLQKDEICCAAQTICRIIGQNKYSVLFDVQRGNSPLSPETLTCLANKLPGLEVLSSEPVYVEPPSTSVEDSSRLETDEDGISEIEAMENHEAVV